METENLKQEVAKCLNCGTPLSDRFCAHCGQDSREIKKSVWNFSLQFFENLTDLDNRLWASLFPLLFKPGYLTQSYLEGKRKRYLNPVQMYAFFSFLFFLSSHYLPKWRGEEELSDQIFKEIKQEKKSEADNSGKDSISLNSKEIPVTLDLRTDSTDTEDSTEGFKIGGVFYTYDTYDSIQATLPEEKKHGWFLRILFKKILFFNKKAKEKDGSVFKTMVEDASKNMPTVVIVLVPVLGFLLFLLYFRKRLYYVEHLVMAFHLHCSIFFYLSLVELFVTLFPALNDHFDWVFLWCLGYTFLAMKRFYKQGWIKTFLKLNLLTGFYSFFLLIGVIINVFIAALLVE